jgi:hypothetical protein
MRDRRAPARGNGSSDIRIDFQGPVLRQTEGQAPLSDLDKDGGAGSEKCPESDRLCTFVTGFVTLRGYRN